MSSLIERALAGQPVPRPPVWFMRQAGRYMKEYRELRAKVSFLKLCGDADLACQVTLQPVERFRVDAAIVFSDILPVLEAIGREIRFDKGHGPRVLEPVRSASDAASLRRPDVADALPVVPETIRRFRSARPQTPILGFAGAPFTLLCYLVQGSGSRNWEHVKALLWSEPTTADHILSLLADVVGDYLQSQIDAGAVAVQIFDTWAGILSPEDWRRWSLPYVQRALGRCSGAPRIYYTKDSAPYLDHLTQTGADAISIDWRVDIAQARQVFGPTIPVQGNLDPVALFAPPDEIRRRVRRIIQAAGPRGHVFNLGHGVLPTTPIEGVEAMIDEVHQTRWPET
ncbi:MAG: uroporphyrinogen decarboxylase [Deltaproteobacteria bacterium]|nr:MAG: uroporphyrinogen decarboxylase [Deltaproteobacteria bacterium]